MREYRFAETVAFANKIGDYWKKAVNSKTNTWYKFTSPQMTDAGVSITVECNLAHSIIRLSLVSSPNSYTLLVTDLYDHSLQSIAYGIEYLFGYAKDVMLLNIRQKGKLL